MKEYLTFDDVLLVPQYSTIKSRSEVDLSVNLSKGIKLRSPIIPANMKNIISYQMAVAMYDQGAMSLLHRFSPIDKQIELIKKLKELENIKPGILNFVGVSVGVKPEDKENLKIFNDLGIKIVCIDIAHLDSILGISMIEYISKNYPHMLLIAGNVATDNGAARAWQTGADIVKVGIGSGAICSTRLETGHGVPQLSAIIEIHERRKELEQDLNKKLYFISDGGHRKTADIVKSLCFADMVMIGSMLAGTTETGSKDININGEIYKAYEGSSTHKTTRVEGVKGLVKPKGSVIDIVKRIHEGIQSACSYQNSHNLQELKEDPNFIKVSASSLTETNIHDVKVVE